MKSRIGLTAALALSSWVALAAADNQSPRPGVEITAGELDPRLNDLAVATAIEDKQPTGAADSHPADVGFLYCWSSTYTTKDTAPITHTWRHGDRVIRQMNMEVRRSVRWRSWSKQRINPRLTGAWSCEVTSESGETLGKASFTVQ